jgi:hypothetical protein
LKYRSSDKKKSQPLIFRLSQSEFLNPARSKVRILGFNPITRSPRSILIFLKNQNDIILVKQKKTKVNGLQPGFWPGHSGFWLSLFFLKLGLVPASGWPGPGSTCQAGFQNYDHSGEIWGEADDMLPTYIFFSIFLDILILKNFLKNKTSQALKARLKSQIAWTFFLLYWFFLFFFINFII